MLPMAPILGTRSQGTSIQKLTGHCPKASCARWRSIHVQQWVNTLLTGGLNIPLKCSSDPDGCIIGSEQSPITVRTTTPTATCRAGGVRARPAQHTNQHDRIQSGCRCAGSRHLWPGCRRAVRRHQLLPAGDGAAVRAGEQQLETRRILPDQWERPQRNRLFPPAQQIRHGHADHCRRCDLHRRYRHLRRSAAARYRRDERRILGNVAFCNDAANSCCNPSINKMLVFNRSDTYTFDGAISVPARSCSSAAAGQSSPR